MTEKHIIQLYSFYFIYYIEIIIFLFFAFFISVLLFLVSYFCMPQSHDKELISHYECGFIPFDNARKPFEIKFYLVAILFLIFDLEITFLFPLGTVVKSISNISVISLAFFFIVLTIGFYFEWIYKGLDWGEMKDAAK